VIFADYVVRSIRCMAAGRPRMFLT